MNHVPENFTDGPFLRHRKAGENSSGETQQPSEDCSVVISRAAGTVTFPANFMLVAAMNPCPCGYYGDAKRQCPCSGRQIENYRQRISGPLLDRIDIHVEVPAVSFRELQATGDGGESSATIRRGRIQFDVQRWNRLISPLAISLVLSISDWIL